MSTEFVLQLLAYTLPALISAALAYTFFNRILRNQTKKDLVLLEKLKTQNTIDLQALKLQAFERFIILIERIDLKKLVLRITPTTEDKVLYQINLINHIEQEFDYNVAQQIYISEELWQIIVQSKNSIIELIHQIGNNPNIIDASQLRQTLIAKNIIIEEKLEIARKAIKLEVNTITDK